MSIKLNSVGGGSVTIQEPNTASDFTLSVPAANATLATLGPAFSAYKSGTDQSISSGVPTLVTFDSTLFNEGSCYSTSTNRFTPNVAGYYYILASVGPQMGSVSANMYIAKNANITDQGLRNAGGYLNIRYFTTSGTQNYIFQGSAFTYMNGTTDYISIYFDYGLVLGGQSGGSDRGYFMGYLVRTA
jgi:hypothetical protein